MQVPRCQMSETMTEICRRRNSLSDSRMLYFIKHLRQKQVKFREMLSVSQRTIERDRSAMQKKGILRHERKENDGA